MHIAVIGTGCIGAFTGGHLLKSGQPVSFLARQKTQETLQQHGLRLTDCDGGDDHLSSDRLDFIDPAGLEQASHILVAVKSRHTMDVARQIQRYAKKDAIILSLQNGIRNKERLADILGQDRDIRRVMVPWNVTEKTPGHFHRGTGGQLMVEAGPTALADLFTRSGLAAETRHDMDNILWGKLLLNLNNALNALSNLPLQQELMNPGWRQVLAISQQETLAVLKAMDIEPVAALPLPPRWLPVILRLPTFLYKRIAAASLKIDADARSSMWDDLQKGRPTEIDDLQGEVIRHADQLGLAVPVLKRTLAMVKAAEDQQGRLSPARPEDFTLHSSGQSA